MATAPSARLAIRSSRSSFAIASTAGTDIKWRAPARLRPRRFNDMLLIRSSHSRSERMFSSIQNPCTSSIRSAIYPQTFRKQLRQFLETAFCLSFVIDGTVRRSPTVICAIGDFAFKFPAPNLEFRIDFFNRLQRHALILDSVREIESRLDSRQDEMRARRGIGEKPAAMERCGRGNSV